MDEYITVEEVASILRVGTRQAARYAERVRTRKAGRRVLFHRGDIEQVAEELGADNKSVVPPPAEMVPLGTMLETFERQQHQVALLSRELGRLEGLLEAQQKQLQDTENIRRRLWEVERELEELKRRQT